MSGAQTYHRSYGFRKEPREGSEIEPETMCLQPIKAPYVCDDVLFVERANELRYVARLST